MKKILFLLIICIIKLNAYEYLFYYNDKTSYDTQVKRAFFIDSNGKFVMRLYHDDRFDTVDYINYAWLSCIKFDYSDAQGKYIKNDEFQNYFKNDLSFLNNLYTSNNTNRNVFLNYLYNENRFSNVNYINYENYELLYNSNGLVVESIVNGNWAGLYDDNEKQFSGKLYDKDGFLLYSNGEKVDYIGKWLNQLTKPFDTTFMGVVNILSFAALSAIICYYVMDALWYIIDLALWALTGVRRHLSYEYYH